MTDLAPPPLASAELHVLASLLAGLRPDTPRPLAAGDFEDPLHLAIFEAITGGTATHPDTLAIAVPAIDQRTLHALRAIKATAASATETARLLLHTRQRRHIARILKAALNELPAADPDAIALKLAGTLAQSAASQAALPARASAQRLAARVGGSLAPIPTGLPPLDHVLHGGLHKASLSALLARPKVGKSLLVATLAGNLAAAGVATLAISLERREDELERFIMARALGIDAADLAAPPDPLRALAIGEYVEHDRPLWYLHRPGIRIPELRQSILAATLRHRIKVVLVDYLQLITGPDGRPASREQIHSEAAQMLADLAACEDLAIMVTGQLDANGAPRHCDGLLASAAIVTRLHRPERSDLAFLDTIVCNRGPERVAGSPDNPSLVLDLRGPHFRAF